MVFMQRDIFRKHIDLLSSINVIKQKTTENRISVVVMHVPSLFSLSSLFSSFFAVGVSLLLLYYFK